MGVHITKEQIKVIQEDEYAVEPTYSSDKVIVLDVADWSLDPNQNLITQETLTSAGITAAIPGGYTLSGSTTIPVRMSQLGKLNLIGLGYGGDKTVQVTDDSGNTVYTMTCELSIPTQKYLPSFTVYHLIPEPEVAQVVYGAVFTNLRAEWTTDRILTYSLDLNAAKDKIVKAPADGFDPTTQPQFIDEPLPPQDFIRGLDAALYGDIKLVKYDATNNQLVDDDGNTYTPVDGGDGYYTKCTDSSGNSWTIIDVLPIKPSDETGTTIFDEVRYIIGRRILGLRSIRADLRIETDRNTHRLGSRFAVEYPMRKVIRQDFSGTFTADFASSTATDSIDSFELYNIFYDGAKSEDVIEPTEASIGTLSLVIKVGAAFDVKPTDTQADKRIPWAFGFNAQDPLMYNASLNTPTLGTTRRGVYIFPNVVLERATRRDAAATLKTVDYSFRLLPGDLGSDYVTTLDSGETLQLSDMRAYTFVWYPQ